MTTSTAQPPADVVDATSSAYMLFGLRGELPRPNWKLSASGSFGSSLGQNEGQWILADANGSRNWFGAHHNFSLAADAFGLRYSQPFEYQAFAAELTPSLSLHTRSLQLTATPRGTLGFWSGDGEDGDIGVVGVSVQLSKTFGLLSVGVSGEAHDARNAALNGNYSGAGADASLSLGPWALGGSVKRWRNPLELEWGYSAFATVAIARGFEIDAELARSVTDPVLASPGSIGASLGVSWRLFSGAKRQPPPVARVAQARQPGRVVIFTIEADVETAAVSGSFSEWRPIEMRKDGRRFTAEVAVPPGTHHYGFLLDDKDWFVPANALGIVDDDFGRKNATLVIERE